MSFLSGLFKPVGKLVGGITNALGMGELYESITSPKTYAQDMANMQQENNIAMWNLQNEYNTPAKQMERFAEAGLNPNLAYEKATNGNAETPASADYQQAGLQSQQQAQAALFNILSTGISLSKALSSIRTQDAQTDMYHQLANKYAADAKLSGQTFDWNNRYRTDEYLNGLINSMIGKGYQNLSLGTLNKLFLDQGAARYDENGNLIDYPLGNLMQSRYTAEMAKNWSMPEYWNAKINQIMASTGLTRAQANRIAELLPLEKIMYDNRGRLIGLQSDWQDMMNVDYDRGGGMKLPFGLGSLGGMIRGYQNFFDFVQNTIFTSLTDAAKKLMNKSK